MRFRAWDSRLLGALGIPVTPHRLRFLEAWQACEGGSAAFNPLNTTMRLPGSSAYNQAGVQHYTDEEMGIAATLLTLRLPYYRALVAALRKDGFTAEQILHASISGLTTWGTGTRCIATKLAEG